MKVIWLVNIVLPMAASALQLPATYAGGWLEGQIQRLNNEDIEIFVISPVAADQEMMTVDIGNTHHYLMPYDKMIEDRFRLLIQQILPDVVHIFGTEFPHCLEMVKACEDGPPAVITLQGMVRQVAKYYFEGLPSKYQKPSLYSIFFSGNYILREHNIYESRGNLETEAIKRVNYIIGRTYWDQQRCLEINPQLTYFHVDEILRDAFYGGELWDYAKCKKHTIFVSQASYPIKGLHQLLKALPAVIKKYPDTFVYVAGDVPTAALGLFMRFLYPMCNEYQGYLNKLIKKNCLAKHIAYTGPLSEKNMKQQYLKCNIFASCSSLENSSNSIGEAMMLGVPVIASRVGGTESIFTDKQDGILYEFNDVQALSDGIMKLFEMQDSVTMYTRNAVSHAHQTHDRDKNTRDLINVYHQIVK